MKVSISKTEFAHIREGVIKLDNAKVSQEFNNLLRNKVPHVHCVREGDNLVIDIDEATATKIFSIIVPHMAQLGQDLNPTIFAVPKIIADGKGIWNDLKKSL